MTSREVHAVLEETRKNRPFRSLFYLFLGSAGGVLAYDPTQSLDAQEEWIRWVWGTFLLSGAALSILGSWVDNYIVEWLGLPLLFVTMIGFGVILVMGSGSTAAWAVALICSSVATVVFSRGYGLWRLSRASLKAKKNAEGRPDA